MSQTPHVSLSYHVYRYLIMCVFNALIKRILFASINIQVHLCVPIYVVSIYISGAGSTGRPTVGGLACDALPVALLSARIGHATKPVQNACAPGATVGAVHPHCSVAAGTLHAASVLRRQLRLSQLA